MLLRHIGWNEAADLVIRGIEKAISAKQVTYDFARLMGGGDGPLLLRFCGSRGQQYVSCSMKAPKLEDFEFRMERSLNLDEVAALYLEAGWITEPVDKAALGAMLKGSFAVSAAFLNGRLVGMMRAFSDGVSDAYMLDLVVLKEHRKHGIGREILERLAAYLKEKGCDWVLCVGAPGTEAFYARTSGKKMDSFTPMRF